MNSPLGPRHRQAGDGAFLAPPRAGDMELNQTRNNQVHTPAAAEPSSQMIAQDHLSRNDHLDVPDSIGWLQILYYGCSVLVYSSLNTDPFIVQASYKELKDDARDFAINTLKLNDDQTNNFIRAALVAKDSRVYDLVGRGDPDYENRKLPVKLTPEE